MAYSRYLSALLAGLLLWVMSFLAFTWFIDPFGVSPVRVTSARLNKIKLKRVDIDRQLKPFEVWRLQPRTVFLGTSRIHQGFDPAVLNPTTYVPAYNASIPASSLGLNISHLNQYVVLDKRLKHVFAELFLYNFLGQGQERTPKKLSTFVSDSAGLFLSNDVLWASVLTLAYNLFVRKPVYEIARGGFYYYPPGHDASGPFGGFHVGIWQLHETRATGMKLHEPAFDAFHELIETARRHDVNLSFVLTPNHAYDDYYIDSIGAWDKVEEWLSRLSSAPVTIYSFSQPNDWTYEPVGKDMRFWNDPYHFSVQMGNAMQRAMAGLNVAAAPENFMIRMTPDKVPGHIEQRRSAIRRWAQRNPKFVQAFESEKQKWESEYLKRSGAAKR